jgi:hypothetical protein
MKVLIRNNEMLISLKEKDSACLPFERTPFLT